MNDSIDAHESVRLGRPFWFLWGATSATALGDGIRMAILPLLAAALTRNATVVAAGRLDAANARLAIPQTTSSEFAGPPLGGLLFGLSSVAAFFADALVFAIGSCVLAFVPRRAAKPADGQPLLHAVGEGLRW